MGTTTAETTTKFEFHDLGDTRGVIFNKVTGEMEYKEIRTEPLSNPLEQISSTITVKGDGYGSQNYFTVREHQQY
mgnify:CR=1 FL=1